MPDAVGIFDNSDNLVFYNSKFNELYSSIDINLDLGTNYENILSNAVYAKKFEGIESDYESWLQQRIREHKNLPSKSIIYLANGEVFECFQKKLPDGNTLVLNKNITDYVRNSEIQTIKATKAESMLNNVFDGVLIIDSLGNIDYSNKAANNIISDSKKNFSINNIKFLIKDFDLNNFLDSKKIGKIREFVGLRDNNEFPLEVVINFLEATWQLVERRKKRRKYFIVTLRDITEPKIMAAQLQHSQKMDAIGTLAGGIAHDFNNILSIIIGSGSLLQENLNQGSEDREHADMLLKAASRARDLVKQILDFSQPTEEKKSVVDLSHLTNEVISFMRNIVPKSIEISDTYHDEKVHVFVDSAKIHRVLVNIITNSYQAIGDSSGKISISCKKKYINEDNYPHMLDEEEYVEIKISDTGSGISSEISNRIFEPFFSTKKNNSGTGLGLSMVHGIIKEHRGYIDFSSSEGKGTSFIILLPITEQDSVHKKAEKYTISNNKKGKILFVDDEELIVKVSVKILENLGYEVLGLTNSEEALEQFKSNPQLFSLIITDQNMPGMTGGKLVQEIRKLSNQIPVILCTGYSDKMNLDKADKIGANAFVAKPLEKKELVGLVNKFFSS